MKMEGKTERTDVLDRETLEILGSAPEIMAQSASGQARLREQVMARVDEETKVSSNYLTIRENDGDWNEIAPQVKKKVLRVDHETGEELFLLRMQPGATLEEHDHSTNELCMVLEGDVSFDDFHLKAGDFHYALKGSSHGTASTVSGALLFLQTATVPMHAMA